jgi:hypothetical protein
VREVNVFKKHFELFLERIRADNFVKIEVWILAQKKNNIIT